MTLLKMWRPPPQVVDPPTGWDTHLLTPLQNPLFQELLLGSGRAPPPPGLQSRDALDLEAMLWGRPLHMESGGIPWWNWEFLLSGP